MEHLDPERRRRVTEARVARLATVRPDGRPHVVAVTFAFDGTTIVTAIDHKPKTTTSLQRLRNIEARPVASLIVDHYEDDWSRLWWLRADGTARIVQDGNEWQEGIERLTLKYRQYQEDPPEGPVIVITVTRWTSWSADQDV
jgi:PPOX class probable F420-dependent enzyme